MILPGLPFENNSFDCVTCFQVLEHIPYPVYDRVLNELSRVSKKYLVISVPYQENTEDDVTKCPACHTVFNVELHLRNYFDKDIQQLFSKFGFKNIKHELIEKYNEQYLGVDAYIKFRNAHLRNKGKFRSPICPVCGHENADFKMVEAAGQTQPSGSGIKSLLKKIWPKVKLKNNWVIAVYEKV